MKDPVISRVRSSKLYYSTGTVNAIWHLILTASEITHLSVCIYITVYHLQNVVLAASKEHILWCLFFKHDVSVANRVK